MEEEMIEHLNYTEKAVEILEHSVTYKLIDILAVLTSSLGLISDAIIIYVVLKNKRMRTRTNLFLANWAIIHAIATVTDTIFPRFVLDYHTNLGQIMYNASNVYPACLLIVALLLNTNISTKVMCCIVYGFISTIFTIAIFTTVHSLMHHSIQFFLLFVLVLFLICLSIIADIVISSKNSNADGMFKQAILRMLYCCQIVFTTIFLLDQYFGSIIVIQMLVSLFPLVAVIILVILYKNDGKFKLCVDHMLICKWDSTVDDDDSVEGGMIPK